VHYIRGGLQMQGKSPGGDISLRRQFNPAKSGLPGSAGGAYPEMGSRRDPGL